MISPGKSRGKRGEDIPPLPKVPERSALRDRGNRQSRPGSLGRRTGSDKGRPFAVIEEEEEGGHQQPNDVDHKQGREEWEWPNDVF